jgi:NAD(P)-dependent dehydrogenase (short-subunit alcohol dehydrogenase family)
MAVDPLFDLSGRVAVVTGAGGGLGTELCAGLAACGADVALVDVAEEPLQAAARRVQASGRRALPVVADVSDEGAVDEVFARVDGELGLVDILVNLPFAPASGTPEKLALSDWDRSFTVNLTTYFLCGRAAARRMIERGAGGAILNMGSIGGSSAIGRGSFAYDVSKGGVVMMTKEQAIEWARYGIRVNSIQPCQFSTPGLQKAIADRGRGDLIDTFLAGIPLDRLGRPEEIVGPAIFLVSDAASMVTGVSLPVDGGNLAFNAGGTKERVA